MLGDTMLFAGATQCNLRTFVSPLVNQITPKATDKPYTTMSNFLGFSSDIYGKSTFAAYHQGAIFRNSLAKNIFLNNDYTFIHIFCRLVEGSHY